MNFRNIHIVIIEPSEIVYEGILAMISKVGRQCTFSKLENIQEIHTMQLKRSIDLIMVNPVLVQTNLKLFTSIKTELNNVRWVALVYSLFDQQTLSLFDDVIYINDSSIVISQKIQKVINASNKESSDLNPDVLSEREVDVLKLLVEGNANKEIADKLNISTHTVITHRKNISLKTGIKSVSGLTIYAVVKKIISLNSFKS